MTQEVQRVQALAQGATLSALALALLALQFAIPFSFLVLSWLTPLAVSSGISRLPWRVVAFQAFWIIGASFAIFGLITGSWAVFYVVFGGACGLLHRLRLALAARVFLAALVHWAALQAMAVWLIFLGRALSFGLIDELVDEVRPYWPVWAAAVAVFSLSSALLTSLSLDRIENRLTGAKETVAHEQ